MSSLKDAAGLLDDSLKAADQSQVERDVIQAIYPKGQVDITLDHRGNVSFDCPAFHKLHGANLGIEDFLATADAVNALLLEGADGVERVPADLNYPADFVYRGDKDA